MSKVYQSVNPFEQSLIDSLPIEVLTNLTATIPPQPIASKGKETKLPHSGHRMRIRLFEARDLPRTAFFSHNLTDAYATLSLLGTQVAVTSEIVTKTVSPTWNKTWDFHLSLQPLNDVVSVRIFGHKSLAADRFLGRVEIPLALILSLPAPRRLESCWFRLLPEQTSFTDSPAAAGSVRMGFEYFFDPTDSQLRFLQEQATALALIDSRHHPASSSLPPIGEITTVPLAFPSQVSPVAVAPAGYYLPPSASFSQTQSPVAFPQQPPHTAAFSQPAPVQPHPFMQPGAPYAQQGAPMPPQFSQFLVPLPPSPPSPQRPASLSLQQQQPGLFSAPSSLYPLSTAQPPAHTRAPGQEACPVCAQEVSADALAAHVDAHFSAQVPSGVRVDRSSSGPAYPQPTRPVPPPPEDGGEQEARELAQALRQSEEMAQKEQQSMASMPRYAPPLPLRAPQAPSLSSTEANLMEDLQASIQRRATVDQPLPLVPLPPTAPRFPTTYPAPQHAGYFQAQATGAMRYGVQGGMEYPRPPSPSN